MSSLLLLLLTAAPHSVVVPQPVVVDVKPEAAAYFAQSLSSALTNKGLKIITQTELQTMLGLERQKQLLGCETETTCLAEISSALGADRILQLSIARFTKSLRVTAKLLNANGDVLFTQERRASSDDELVDIAPSLASEVYESMFPTPKRQVVPSLITGGAALVGVGFGIAGLVQAGHFEQQLRGTSPLSYEAWNAAVAGGETWQWIARIGFGVGGALAVTSVILALALPAESPAAHVNVVMTAQGGFLTVGGAW